MSRDPHDARVKAKVKRILRATQPYRELTPSEVGKQAAVHMRACSCHMCRDKPNAYNRLRLIE